MEDVVTAVTGIMITDLDISDADIDNSDYQFDVWVFGVLGEVQVDNPDFQYTQGGFLGTLSYLLISFELKLHLKLCFLKWNILLILEQCRE